jgi:TRAP-type mannitol/chloroaromatic compound transport system permease small subunit
LEASEAPRASSKRRHRAAVWSLIVIGSIVLVLSILANWVQKQLLDTGQVKSTTEQILAQKDVQQALATYSVDQLYANVDVQGQIANELPGPAKALALPAAAFTRNLATNAAERALATPQVQSLVANLIAQTHGQFVDLIRNKHAFVSNTGGNVVLQYGTIIANLATRLGVDPAAIAKVQGIVRSYSQNLRQTLTTAEAKIVSARTALAHLQGGALTPTLRQSLTSLNQTATQIESSTASVQKAIAGARGQVPAPLQGQLSQVQARVAQANARAKVVSTQTAAVLKDPSQANVQALDATLATMQSRINTLLSSQAVQTPGQIVLMRSNQLSGVQTIVELLRNLGFVLPVLALLMYVAAIYLAKGWRREALIDAGGGIIVATVFILLLRRLLGNGVDSLAASQTTKPAVTAIWNILSAGLRQRALFILAIGIAFVLGGALAGPGRRETAVRRFLAPWLNDHPVAVYAVVAVLFLIWLSFIPGINNTGQVLVIIGLAVLAVVGIEVLRRQVAREFPESRSPARAGP